jgi:hypothetical protein
LGLRAISKIYLLFVDIMMPVAESCSKISKASRTLPSSDGGVFTSLRVFL